jgi:transposase
VEKERKRRTFSAEYKAETVRLLQRSGKSIGQMALELGIGDTALRRWVGQAEIEAGRGPAGRSSAASGKSWWSCGVRTSGCGWSVKS